MCSISETTNLLHSHHGYSIATIAIVLLLLFNFGTFCLYTHSADIFFSLLLVQTVTTAFTFSSLFRAFGWCLVAFNYESRLIYSSLCFVVLNGLKVERWANCHISILHRGRQGDEPAWEKKLRKNWLFNEASNSKTIYHQIKYPWRGEGLVHGLFVIQCSSNIVKCQGWTKRLITPLWQV